MARILSFNESASKLNKEEIEKEVFSVSHAQLTNVSALGQINISGREKSSW